MLKRVFRNSCWLFISIVVEVGFAMGVTWLLARSLGPELFGTYSLWISLIAFFVPLYDFGLTQFSLRTIAQYPEKTALYVKHIWRIKLILGVVGIFVIPIVAYLFDYFDDFYYFFAFISLVLAQIFRIFTILNRSILRAFEWMRIQTMIELSASISRFFLILLVLIFNSNLLIVCISLAVINFIELVGSTYIVCTRTGKNTLSFHKTNQQLSSRQFMIAAAPFAFYSFFVGLYMRADSILLGSIIGVQAVGWYVAAYKIINLFSYLPKTLVDSLYPIYCKEGTNFTLDITRKVVYFFLIISLPLAVGLSFLSDDIIYIVYGAGYEPASQVLKILSWGLIFIFISQVLLAALNSLNRERYVLGITIIVSVVGFISYFILINSFGIIGASIVSVVIELFGMLLMFLVISKVFRVTLFNVKRILILVSISFFTYVSIYFLQNQLDKIFSLLVGFLIYGILILIYLGTDKELFSTIINHIYQPIKSSFMRMKM